MSNPIIGTCRICHTKNVEIRCINLYVVGSEGLDVCHSCEMQLVEHARAMIHLAAVAYKSGYKECKQ